MVLVALVATLLLNAIGLGLLSLSNTETAIASNYRQASQLLYAAEAAADCAIAGVARAASFNDVLAGAARSTFRDTTLTPVLASGERLDLAVLTTSLQATSDADARRGADNPGWRLFLYQPLSQIARTASASEYVAAWVADDAAESDGDPLSDRNDIISIRAQAFGSPGLQRTVEVALKKDPVGVKVLSWREIR